MKLLATIGPKYAVFSVSHYDFRQAPDGTMADGGQPGLQNYAGYTRASHEMQWIELPDVTFAQLYNDYANSQKRKRRYGIHKLSSVRILPKNEWPDAHAFEWKMDNYLWGTHGKDGHSPLKYILLKDAKTPHLEAILTNCRYISHLTRRIINTVLAERNKPAEQEHPSGLSGEHDVVLDAIARICLHQYD